MKKFLTALVLATFLLSEPVLSEGREVLEGDDTQLPVTLIQPGSPHSLQTISLGIGRRRRRRVRRRSWWLRRRARWHNRRRRGRGWRWRGRGRVGLPRYAHIQ